MTAMQQLGHRALVPGLASPHPLGETLPAVYAEDDFLQRLLAGLDCVLAPVHSDLDNLASYLDAAVTPPDFLAWLAGWLGLRVDGRWPEQRRRALVAHGGQLWSGRATASALRQLLSLAFGSDVQVSDSGGASWSAQPGGPLPGSDLPALHVRVRTDGDVDAARSWVSALVAQFCPVAVPATIEVEGVSS